MEEKKSLKERFKEFWADKDKRNTVLCLGGVAATIISAYCLGYKNGSADSELAYNEVLDIVRQGASSRGMRDGLNIGSILAKRGYFGSSYADVINPVSGEVDGICAKCGDKAYRVVNSGNVDSNGLILYDLESIPSQK